MISMLIFSNFERWNPWSPEKDAMETWHTAILRLGAQSSLKCALETWSLRSLRGPPSYFQPSGSEKFNGCFSRVRQFHGL